MTTIDRLVRDYVDEWFLESPMFATAFGAEGYDDQLGDFSAEAYERRDRRARGWLAAVTAIPGDGLSLDERIDRDLVASQLRGRIVTEDWPRWRRDADEYLEQCLFGVSLLFQYRLRPEPELVAAAESRLRQIPGALAAARRNLDPALASPLLLRRSRGMAEGGRSFARDVLPAEVGDPALRARLADAAAVAAEAFGEFAGWLGEFAERAHGDWAMGGERYSSLLRERELLGMDVGELRELGRRAYEQLDAEMCEVAARVPGGGPDWRAVMETLNADHPPAPEALRAEYEAATARARQFLVDHDLVSFADGEECLVVPSPVFVRAVMPIAAYSGPPPLSGRQTGQFWVPYPPHGATPEATAQILRDNRHASIPTITAHETYPGHHWHISWGTRNPRLARHVLYTDYFTEGWGLYAERVMREHGFFADPRHELAHLESRLFRAARIVIDTSLHTGEMTVEQAAEFLTTKVSLTPNVGRAEAERYCAMPTQASAYLTGSLEIERIRDQWRARNPGAPLREFHDLIAGSGALPLGLAEQVVLGGAA